GFGIFISDDLVNPVVRNGDALFGSTVTYLQLGGEGLTNLVELVFYYALADGRTGIAKAVPEPGRNLLLVAGALAVFGLARWHRARAQHATSTTQRDSRSTPRTRER